MVVDIIKAIFVPVFKYCTDWTTALLDCIGGGVVIVAAFAITLIIGMLFIPMRGGNIVGNWREMYDFTQTKISNAKKPSPGFHLKKPVRDTKLGQVKE